MTLKLLQTGLVDGSGGNETMSLASLLSLTSTSNPAYLVVNALDRDEYTVTATGATGSFSGNGATLGLSGIGGDGFGAGLVFTWQAATHQYVNASFGSLSQLDYTDSTSPNDVTNISFFGTSSLMLAVADAGNAYALMQQDAGGYLGSVTCATNADFGAPPPAAATPDGVAAVALSLVGQAWNENGCWVLASTIAAEAGAGLPVQSTEIGKAGAPNGEWIVAYDGPISSNANWQSLVSMGDMVVFATSATTGHITTCVSGAGSTAMLVDNITYVGRGGAIENSANDGSAADVTIAAPHPAAQEFTGVSASSVVIYALDTPAVTDKVADATLYTGSTLSLSTLFSATDPTRKAITGYQVYTASGGGILLNGVAKPSSLASPVTASSLSALALAGGSTPGSDTLEIRASNGTYWGDWQDLTVDVVPAPPKPPVLESKIAAQTWLQGASVKFSLPAGLFKDPQGAALTYTVTGAAGAGLPAWLAFDPVQDVLSGTVPAGIEKLSLVVTATDALGASASTSFAVSVPAAAPVLATQAAAVTLGEGGAFSFALPPGSFADPQKEALTFKATLSNGAALPSWLKFSPAAQSFSGTAPSLAESLQLKITATDTSGLSAAEVVALLVAPATSGSEHADSMGVAALATQVPAAAAGGLHSQSHAPIGFTALTMHLGAWA